jgi:hypothetical protein
MKQKITLLLALVSLFPLLLTAQNRFVFNNGHFTIAQFTDIHWTPGSDTNATTAATIRAVLQAEHPDLAVVTGDVVTADPAMEGWKAVVALFEESRTPFVVVLGNHDREYLTADTIYNFLLASPYYAGEKGPRHLTGCGNCVIPVYASTDAHRPDALLYCIDSNDYRPTKAYGPYDWIHFDQVQWYRRQSSRFTRANGDRPVPALAFFHIPLLEYKDILGDARTYGHANEKYEGASVNSGLFASFLEKQDVMGVFAGHDHDNDYIGIRMGIALAYGRTAGANAYGKLVRGARIIRLHQGKFEFDTWITTPAGREPTYSYPAGTTTPH